MSSSQHPIALRLERYVGGEAKLLATVMGLPLVDGIFPALVLAEALNSPASIAQIGLLIFGGSATLAVILAEMRVSRSQAVRAVLVVGAILIPVAALEAALAPTIQSLVNLPLFERFAALVIAAIATKTASARIGEYLPSPGTIVGLGLIASFDPSGARFVVNPDPVLMAKAGSAAGVGVAFALGVALLGPRLRGVVDVDRFRFGSAVALGLLPLSILQIPGVPVGGKAPLAVVLVAGLLAYAPDQADDDFETSPAAAAESTDNVRDVEAPDQLAETPGTASGSPVTDGGDDARQASPTPIRPAEGDYGESVAVHDDGGAADGDADADADDHLPSAISTDNERPPWL